MNSYQQFPHPSSYYLEHFRESDIEISPFREGGIYATRGDTLVKANDVELAHGRGLIHLSQSDECASYCVSGAHPTVRISFTTHNTKVDPTDIAIAKDVLGQIVEMDAIARSIVSADEDYEEVLSIVHVSQEGVELFYNATTFNTSWTVYFAKNKDAVYTFVDIG
jgi:hypothetical protein